MFGWLKGSSVFVLYRQTARDGTVFEYFAIYAYVLNIVGTLTQSM